MMKKLTAILLFVTILAIPACGDQLFNYPRQASDVAVKDLSFYQPMPGSQTLPNIPGQTPRNIIFCIGDGMGANHIALARHTALEPGQLLTLERLPVVGMMRTYSANNGVTDSAAAITAMASGVKTNNGRIGMTPDGQPYKTILECLRQKGWRSGLVVTSQISHATPAGFAAHVKNRNDLVKIAAQMLADRVDVMFGGGLSSWLPAGSGGNRTDGRDLLKEARAAGYQVIRTREELFKLDDGPAIGLFADDGMKTIAPEPTLEEMSQKAIQMLSSKGRDWFAPKPRFFMMIEGSQIDWAAHSNETDNVIRQTLMFDMAVRRAVEFAQKDGQTLVVVTADHETGGLVLENELFNKKKITAHWTSKHHTAADVPVYAIGPGSEKFAGMMDNTDIARRFAELTGVSPFPVACSDKQNLTPVTK